MIASGSLFVRAVAIRSFSTIEAELDRNESVIWER
jgi:hypothetical protein